MKTLLRGLCVVVIELARRAPCWHEWSDHATPAACRNCGRTR